MALRTSIAKLWAPAPVLAAGTAGTAGYFLIPSVDAQNAVYQVFSLAAAAALAVRARKSRGLRRLGWGLLAAGALALALGDLYWDVYDWVLGTDVPYPSPADVLYLGAYPLLALGILFALQGRRRWPLGEMLEDAVITSAAGLVLWIALIAPIGRESGVHGLARVVSTAYPTVDILLIAALLQLTLPRSRRTAAGVYVACALGLQLVADIVYSWMTLHDSYVSGSWVDAGWLLSYACWIAAAAAPNEPRPSTQRRHAPVVRLVLTSSALLASPLIMLVQSLRGKNLELHAVLPLSFVSAVLVFARLAVFIREQGQAEETVRAAMASLTTSEARHRSLVEHLPLAVYAGPIGSDAALSYVAPQFEDIVGYPPAAWLDDPGFLATLVHPDDAERVALEKERLLQNADDVVCEYRVRARDGREVWILDTMTTVPTEGTGRHYQGFLLDVSERRRLEADLQQAQKMEAIGQLAGGLAHDFNNILMSIAGHARLLRESLETTGENREHVDQIEFASGRAAELTRSLLTFARRQILDDRAIDVVEVMTRMEPMLRRLIGEDVAFDLVTPQSKLVIHADATQLEQVILNLVVNARHAMPTGGTLVIALGEAAGDAHLSVADSGQGMDAATRARAFEPFFTTKGPGEGTGLGLAMAHGFVDQSGGRIWIESEVGRGTTVHIALPLAPLETVADAVPAAAVDDLDCPPYRILLTEDDPGVSVVVARILDEFGCDVTTAATPAEAIAFCADGDFDVLISDMVMPEMNGLELSERVRKLQPGIEVLFMSGYASDVIDGRGDFGAGVQFLQKPFTPSELAGALRALRPEGADVAATGG